MKTLLESTTYDPGQDGVVTPQIADQEEAPTHSGVVSFDSDSYKIADTVTVTLEDQDLNVDVVILGNLHSCRQ